MRVEHLALWVPDLGAAKTFYTRLGGALADEGYHNPRTGLRTWFVSFGQGADGCRLELMQRDDVGPAAETPALGWAHLALSRGSRQAVDDLVAALRAEGVACVSAPRVTGDGYYEAVVADPEGNLVELVG